MAPSDEYRPFMDAMKLKTYIGKVSEFFAQRAKKNEGLVSEMNINGTLP